MGGWMECGALFFLSERCLLEGVEGDSVYREIPWWTVGYLPLGKNSLFFFPVSSVRGGMDGYVWGEFCRHPKQAPFPQLGRASAASISSLE